MCDCMDYDEFERYEESKEAAKPEPAEFERWLAEKLEHPVPDATPAPTSIRIDRP